MFLQIYFHLKVLDTERTYLFYWSTVVVRYRCAIWWFTVFKGYILLQLSHSIVSNSLRPHGLQHARLSCPSPTPRVCSTSCLLRQWCHTTISSSIVPFSCPQSFPASEFFFALCNQGGVICISEVIEISPGNLDSSLCFSQRGIAYDVLCIEVK